MIDSEFECFKHKAADTVKEIIIDHLESRSLSIKQYMRLHDLGFLYIPSDPLNYVMNLSIMVANIGRLGSVVPYLSNEKVYEWIDSRYSERFKSVSDEQRNLLFDDAVNELWGKCLCLLKNIDGFRCYVDWDRNYPMIYPKYRI